MQPDNTHNRPHKTPLRILLKPLHRLLRIPRPPNHLLDRIPLRVGPRARRVRRHIVEDVPQLVGGRRRGGDFELEFSARRGRQGAGFGGRGGLFQDCEGARGRREGGLVEEGYGVDGFGLGVG